MTKDISPNKVARIAGFLYLLLIPFGCFGGMYIPSITVPGNAVETINNITAHQMLFRLSIISALITPLVTILVALFLYKLFKAVNKDQAVLMVIFTVIAAPIVMLNQLSHFAVLSLLNGTGYLKVSSVDQLHYQVMLFLDLQHHGALITGLFWGLWLFPMGYLVLKSGFIPKIIGVFLIIAGFGYIIDSAAFFLSPGLNIAIVPYTFIGEVLMLVWLLFKGGKIPENG